MTDLTKLRRAVSDHFDSIVTVGKLQSSGGTKTVKYAKEIGIFLARKDGHDDGDIAKTFGYSNEKSISRVFSKVKGQIGFGDMLGSDIEQIAEKLGIDLT